MITMKKMCMNIKWIQSEWPTHGIVTIIMYVTI